MAITHAFTSPKADGADTTLVRPSNWNAEHLDIENAIAGVDLGGHRVVVLNDIGKAIYADKDTTEHINKVWGITTGAAAVDEVIKVQTHGRLDEPSWSWTLNNFIFLGNNGLLTQTTPTTGFRCPVAFPLTSTSIFINIKESIQLN
jgi:hypothetical protein